MKKIFTLFLLGIGIALTAKAQTCYNDSFTSDEAAIANVIDKYVQTINNADTTLTSKIWSHDPNVSFIGPTGRYSTYKEIMKNFIIGVWDKKFTDRHLQKDDVKINVNGNMAWVEFKWKFDAIRKEDGKPHNTKGIETQIFKKEPDGWKLVHVHYSAIK